MNISPVVEAHRGFSAIAPENTLCAFRRATGVGAGWIELDVHACATGELVVMHDAGVDRTTNGTGQIADKSLEELKTLDAGSWKGAEFAGETIPTLAETLQLTGETGVRFNVEVKTFSDPSSAKQLADLLRENPAPDGRHVVSSFDREALLQVRDADPTIPLAYLGSGGGIVKQAIDDNFDWVHLQYQSVSLDTVVAAHAAGLKVMIWTMDQPALFAHYTRLGVDKICSNNAAAMLAAARKC